MDTLQGKYTVNVELGIRDWEFGIRNLDCFNILMAIDSNYQLQNRNSGVRVILTKITVVRIELKCNLAG